ncbi:DNA repair protein RadC [Orrella sp. JC864]|uniref:RadC family protein n=1 Tax=Orrella sp. JC864 TaxID=3120298 RepID=UPI0012BB507F
MPEPLCEQAERPRERLLRHGAQVLTDAELLALVLRTGTAAQDAVQMGRALLLRFGGLRALLSADIPALMRQSGLGQAKACQLAAVLELARRAAEEELSRGDALKDPRRVKHYCSLLLGHQPVEHCMALYLDSQLRLIGTEELARGTLSQASVYPREVVRAALRHHAAAVILTHNHPSGSLQPSLADQHLTRQLKQALALVDVRLLDHMVVGGGQAVSMAELGML